MKLLVDGVPEHYNLPWHWAWEHQFSNPLFPAFQWKSYPAGTGAMLKDLRERKLDLAILLTEGAIRDIHQGNNSRIIQFHVDSALRWGIHVGVNSTFQGEEDLRKAKFAISRYTSGSHLMAYVWAKKWNRELDDERDFVLVENLEGARKALSENPDLVFLWERFTTKHLVEQGEFKYLGDVYTPWPSFVVAAREEVLLHASEEVQALLEHVNELTRNLSRRNDVIDILCRKYRMKELDAMEWFTALKWNMGRETSIEELNQILQSLGEMGFVDKNTEALDYFQIIYPVE